MGNAGDVGRDGVGISNCPDLGRRVLEKRTEWNVLAGQALGGISTFPVGTTETTGFIVLLIVGKTNRRSGRGRGGECGGEGRISPLARAGYWKRLGKTLEMEHALI